MFLMLILWLAAQQPPQDIFAVQIDLQGLYDEISQTMLQNMNETDIDQMHDVLFTADWVFVDASGHQHPWSEMRARELQALKAPRVDWIAQPIQKVTTNGPGSASAIVNFTTLRAFADDEGKYGRKGASHTVTEITVYRDTWVKMGDEWRLKSREQVGQPKTFIDKSPYS